MINEMLTSEDELYLVDLRKREIVERFSIPEGYGMPAVERELQGYLYDWRGRIYRMEYNGMFDLLTPFRFSEQDKNTTYFINTDISGEFSLEVKRSNREVKITLNETDVITIGCDSPYDKHCDAKFGKMGNYYEKTREKSYCVLDGYTLSFEIEVSTYGHCSVDISGIDLRKQGTFAAWKTTPLRIAEFSKLGKYVDSTLNVRYNGEEVLMQEPMSLKSRMNPGHYKNLLDPDKVLYNLTDKKTYLLMDMIKTGAAGTWRWWL